MTPPEPNPMASIGDEAIHELREAIIDAISFQHGQVDEAGVYMLSDEGRSMMRGLAMLWARLDAAEAKLAQPDAVGEAVSDGFGAKLKPLDGKYYGTEVHVWNGFTNSIVKVWHHDDSGPSERQLEEWNGPSEDDLSDLCCDTHYETKTSLEMAARLVAAIGGEQRRARGGAT